MEAKEISDLIDKYLSGQANSEETTILEKWYAEVDVTPGNTDLARVARFKQEAHRFLSDYIEKKKTSEPAPFPGQRRIKAIYRWLSAAVVFLSLSTITYFYNRTPANTQLTLTKQRLTNDVAPGGNKAVLTLSNGRQLLLTNTQNGIVATQGGIEINKTSDGKVIYNASQTSQTQGSSEMAYNAITTPVGGTYYLKLTDGTQVWLNAASSIKYPTSFKGNERVVELTGEAYFEVAKNRTMPFRVKCAGQTVEVLGTHFNINTYLNEPSVKTTLLEGSVKITAAGDALLLKPGQQAAFNSSAGKHLKISGSVNLDEVMAWKNGKFLFAGADIQTVMRQLERWYNVTAVYEGTRPSDHFNGKIPKNVNLSEVLKVLELSGVHFKIEGRKIVIR